jgi:hypothetical protein
MLDQRNGRWFVYCSERGLESEKKEFAAESEACEDLLKRLRNDPTTLVDAPMMTAQKLFEILCKERIREANGRCSFLAQIHPSRLKKQSSRPRGRRANTFDPG